MYFFEDELRNHGGDGVKIVLSLTAAWLFCHVAAVCGSVRMTSQGWTATAFSDMDMCNPWISVAMDVQSLRALKKDLRT